MQKSWFANRQYIRRLAFQPKHLPRTSMYCFKREGWSNTTTMHFLVQERQSQTQFMRAQAQLLPYEFRKQAKAQHTCVQTHQMKWICIKHENTINKS